MLKQKCPGKVHNPLILACVQKPKTIRSFAGQMLHLASGNVFLIGAATGAKIDWPGRGLENSPGAQNKDSVVWYVTRSYDFAIESIKALDPDKYGEMVGEGNRKAMRYTLLLKAFEHQTHHRGQTRSISGCKASAHPTKDYSRIGPRPDPPRSPAPAAPLTLVAPAHIAGASGSLYPPTHAQHAAGNRDHAAFVVP